MNIGHGAIRYEVPPPNQVQTAKRMIGASSVREECYRVVFETFMKTPPVTQERFEYWWGEIKKP